MVGAAIAPGVGEAAIIRALIAWTQLFGMISFELFGQLVGSADPADDFFGYAVDQMAGFVGLPSVTRLPDSALRTRAPWPARAPAPFLRRRGFSGRGYVMLWA